MKKLICAILVCLLMTGPAFAVSVQVENGPVTLEADGEMLTLESFHILGVDAEGNYLIHDGTALRTVSGGALKRAVILPEAVPGLGGLETLTRGTKSDAVIPVQAGLKTLGYLMGSADGDFGPGTESAVKAFQEAVGLEATGQADEVTQLLIASMAGEPVRVDTVVDPEIMYAPIMGKTAVDIQPILDSGLVMTYSELAGEGFISDGTVIRYDASGSTDLDKYELAFQFGLQVTEEGGVAEIVPVMKVSCLCVRRPVLTGVTIKAGAIRGSAPVEDLQVRLEGVDTVEEGIVRLSEEMVDALAQSGEGLLIGIEGQYNSFEARLENDLSALGRVAQEIRK